MVVECTVQTLAGSIQIQSKEPTVQILSPLGQWKILFVSPRRKYPDQKQRTYRPILITFRPVENPGVELDVLLEQDGGVQEEEDPLGSRHYPSHQLRHRVLHRHRQVALQVNQLLIA